MDITSEADNGEVKTLAKTLETIFITEGESTVISENATSDGSLEKATGKNPMLISPVIRCVLKFLNIEDIKNCRLVSREWGSTGKLILACRALISFSSDVSFREPVRRPADFQSCFPDSATLFSAFKISGYLTNQYGCHPWTNEELTTFFDEQQKYIKELTLKFCKGDDKTTVENIDLSSWILKSPLVQKDAKHMTKLSINDAHVVVIPINLIAHIKDLKLSYCLLNLEAGIQLCPIKLYMADVTFFQDGVKLKRVLINDIVDFVRAKEVSLHNLRVYDGRTYVLDLGGNITLDKLILNDIETVNGSTSQWVIEHFDTNDVQHSFHSQMEIKELFLSMSHHESYDIDLFILPNSIEKLDIFAHSRLRKSTIYCSRSIMLKNLQYLSVNTTNGTNLSFLAHFMNCPQLSHLKLVGRPGQKMKSHWMPRSIKTLTLENPLDWVCDKYMKLDKLVLCDMSCKEAIKLDTTIFNVDVVVMYYKDLRVDLHFTEFYRERSSFGRRLYIGKLQWCGKKFEENLLKDVDVKSSCYVFQNGEKGRAVSEKAFHDLIPKHW